MDTRSKPMEAKRYEIYFEPGEFTLIRKRNDPALSPMFQDMMSGKVMDVLLRRHLNVDSKCVEIIRIDSPEESPKHWGVILEVLYRIRGEQGSYRHVFHLMLTNGDLSGQLFTQTWRFIAK